MQKGSVYLSGHGSEERMSLVPLHDEQHGVVISVHCFDKHGEHLLPENVEYCQSLSNRYDDYDYGNLMNTTFGLVPSGRSPGTFRLGEVMSAGAIPVFVGRDLVPPFRERFDWPSFSFSFSPDQVGAYMVETLRAVPRAQLDEMQVSKARLRSDIHHSDVPSTTIRGSAVFFFRNQAGGRHGRKDASRFCDVTARSPFAIHIIPGMIKSMDKTCVKGGDGGDGGKERNHQLTYALVWCSPSPVGVCVSLWPCICGNTCSPQSSDVVFFLFVFSARKAHVKASLLFTFAPSIFASVGTPIDVPVFESCMRAKSWAHPVYRR